MKILVAPDSFKGTLSPLEAARAIREGLLITDATLEITLCPLSDGGEGFLEAVSPALGLSPLPLPSLDVAQKSLQIEAGVSTASRQLFVESARIIGFEQLPEGVSLMERSTAGIGHTIAAARSMLPDHHIFLSLGGSTTMDCGLGAAHALGCTFLDKEGIPLGPSLKTAHQIREIRLPPPSLHTPHGHGTVLCDVRTCLTGPHGAASTFGPQKGASEDEVGSLERIYEYLLPVMARSRGGAPRDLPGYGAAGGIGAMLSLLFDWPLSFGTPFLWENLHIDALVAAHDLVITGEGRFDGQSLMGKATGALVQSAQKAHTRLIILSGLPGKYHAPYGDLIPLSSAGNRPPATRNEAYHLLSDTASRLAISLL